MSVYEYKAINSAGKKISGLIEAETAAQAKTKLRNSDTYPITVRESNKTHSTKSRNLNLLFNRIRPDEVHVFTRQIATLINAGLPLITALNTIANQSDNSSLQQVILNIKTSINEGQSFSDSLTGYPHLFSPVYINMIHAGETSGTLGLVLERLADFGESQQALNGKLKAALIYPAFMAVIGTAILVLLITYIVPNITQVFDDMNKVLPLPTQLLLGLSSILSQYWWLVLSLITVLIVLIKQLIKHESGKNIGDFIKLRFPIIGPVVHKIILARFSATLGSLVKSNVELISSLQIVKALVNNVHIAQVIDMSIEDIQKGASITKSLTNSPWFPPMLIQMLAVGEQSGSLAQMLDKAADAYEREVDTAVSGMTSLIEPIMISVMGVAVGFVVLSILLPIFEMNQMIG